jgi:hypothetical protein
MLSSRYCCQFLTKFEFARQIFKKYSTNFMKICPVGTELFHADRQAGKRNSTGETRGIFPIFEGRKAGEKQGLSTMADVCIVYE